MIGQVTAGEPSLGVVYQPAAERLWLAERDRGAFEIVEDRPLARITVSAIHQIADARMVSSASTREELVEKVRTSAGIRDELQVGSVGVKLCLIASAARDIYMNPAGAASCGIPLPPEVILQEAGWEADRSARQQAPLHRSGSGTSPWSGRQQWAAASRCAAGSRAISRRSLAFPFCLFGLFEK
jgi:3'-phosphoadenosine 5'-phosphosulfate (PAPS) 3'-phosphatase